MRMLMLAAVLGTASLVLPRAPHVTSTPSATTTAKQILGELAGSWSFAFYQAGHATPIRTGHRDMRLLADSLKLTWRDTYVGRADTAMGFLGYAPRASSYYLMGVSGHSPDPMYLVGTQTAAGLEFDPATSPAGAGNRSGVFIASQVRVVDANHFEWRAADGTWWVDFTRVGDR